MSVRTTAAPTEGVLWSTLARDEDTKKVIPQTEQGPYPGGLIHYIHGNRYLGTCH